MKKTVYLGLGSNLGDKNGNLLQAREQIAAVSGIEITAESSLYVTAPWGKTDQEEFLNQVLKIETDLSAIELLHALQNIEINMGRQRLEKWGPRIIDLDILLYGDEVIDGVELTVPHPYMRQRLFVLVPLQEISPELVFPDNGAYIGEVLNRVLDREGNQEIKRV